MALVLATTLPLVWRRRHPLAVALVTGMATAAYGFAHYPDLAMPIAIGGVVGMYSVAAWGGRRAALLAGGVAAVVVVVVMTLPRADADVVDAAFVSLSLAGAWVLGDRARVQRALTAELQERAARLERDRAEDARRAVAFERARIARELHDVVAHHVSMMVVQAEAGPVAAERDPARAAGAFEAIAATGRQALVEMRRLLGVLRDDGDQAPSRAPQPGLGQVPALIEQVGRAGLRVELVVEGTSAALPPGIDLSAYRIVQEALTNVMTHSGAGRARVLVRYGADDLELRISDDGGSESSEKGSESASGRQATDSDRQDRRSAGRGLLGMRERVALFGGELTAGPGPAGGLHRGRPPPRRGRGPVIRTLVVDDQGLVRAGFRMILEAQPDIEVVGEAADGLDAVDAARRLRPDVVLMDIRMPRLDGLEATRRLAGPGAAEPVRVLILTTFDLDEYVFEALRAGASGFLLKDLPREDLVAAVRVVAAGDALLAPRVTRRLIEEFARRPAGAAADPDALAHLTAREREVLELLAAGLSNAEMAASLVVSEHTVKTHVGNVLAKLGLRDRIQAVILAYEVGVVQPGRG